MIRAISKVAEDGARCRHVGDGLRHGREEIGALEERHSLRELEGEAFIVCAMPALLDVVFEGDLLPGSEVEAGEDVGEDGEAPRVWIHPLRSSLLTTLCFFFWSNDDRLIEKDRDREGQRQGEREGDRDREREREGERWNQ